MSGYGGYSTNIVSYPTSFRSEYITIKKTFDTININCVGNKELSNSFEWIIYFQRADKIFPKTVVDVNCSQDIALFYRYWDGEKLVEIKLLNGLNTLPESKVKSSDGNWNGIYLKESIEGVNITIRELPSYPGALVFDGVDDYVSLDAFDSGFKTMFIECSYVSLNTILYDQRKVGTEQEDCINTSAYEAGFYGRNKYGKTYINGVYNKPDSTLIASKLSNKHILITSTLKGDYTSTPCIASSNVNKGMYCNMALYKFLGFKEALTEEQIQAVIKKYNLLDGIDEIEVS